MGSAFDARVQGNHLILTKVDKLRELIGQQTSLPQLVVVGDQSSGKSSVLEGLTRFAFPRDAELCTRYATQITCRRELRESITVSIIPRDNASPLEQDRVRNFNRTLTDMTTDSLAQLFKEANEAMGIINPNSGSSSPDRPSLHVPAFSEHLLKVEKLGPAEEHFTVIDVPGIFRKETSGVTQESDIELVRNMVKGYMRDPRTIILAIMPCNVDPATQEILKLAKEVDPQMTRTMAVLTKPDLAIERAMKQIAIDHVQGKRKDLTLGYFVVKNRGSDDSEMTLDEGLAQERQFFDREPWSALARTGRSGMSNLKLRVQELLIDLIKREFPKLRADVSNRLSELKYLRNDMGAPRGDENSQRAYLSKMSEAFQDRTRDALNADYTRHKLFLNRHDLRLITRVVETTEKFHQCIERYGHTWGFMEEESDSDSATDEVARNKFNIFLRKRAQPEFPKFLSFKTTQSLLGELKKDSRPDLNADPDAAPDAESIVEYPQLDHLLDTEVEYSSFLNEEEQGIMEYIEQVYRNSRGQELGIFGGKLLATMFKEQSKKWNPITRAYIGHVILMVHHFISEVTEEICPDPKVLEQLWDNVLSDELQKSYERAMQNVKFLLSLEREGDPLTLNHYFNDNLQKGQSARMLKAVKSLEADATLETTEEPPTDDDEYGNSSNKDTPPPTTKITLNVAQLSSLVVNKANAEHVREYMHDVLKSYYKVSRKRFVDVVYQQSINHFLLKGPDSPLHIFTTDMVLRLNPDQLDIIAGEDALVKDRREKLNLDIESYEKALKVLRGSG